MRRAVPGIPELFETIVIQTGSDIRSRVPSLRRGGTSFASAQLCHVPHQARPHPNPPPAFAGEEIKAHVAFAPLVPDSNGLFISGYRFRFARIQMTSATMMINTKMKTTLMEMMARCVRNVD